MARIHELPHRRPIGLANAFRRVDRPFNFPDDVARAAKDDFAHFAFGVLQFVRAGVAQRSDTQNFRGSFAFRPALGVFTAAELVLHVRIDDQQRGRRVVHRHQFGFAAAAIQQEQVAFAPQGGNELVHDAARNPGKLVFRGLRD